MSKSLKRVIKLRDEHRQTWRSEGDLHWALGLLEEVAELLLALVGLHEGPADWELCQIASIAINWMEKMEETHESTETS